MGYMRHHAIIVTSWDEALLKTAHSEALNVFGDGAVSPLLAEGVNGDRTFLVGPDGSKEGWPESDQGDTRRARFVDWLRAQTDDEDGSSTLCWVEVQYGDDDGDTRIVRHSDEGLR